MRFLALLSLFAAAGAFALPSSLAPLAFVPGQLAYVPAAQQAGLYSAPGHHGEIADAYMVVLRPGLGGAALRAHTQLVGAAQQLAVAASTARDGAAGKQHGIRHVYDLGPDQLQGYAGTFSDDVLAYIRAQPEVAYVERDSLVHTTVLPFDARVTVEDAPGAGASARSANSSDPHSIEKGAPWGLARISHRPELGFGTFNKYVYDKTAGDGVTAYIIDTGIYIDHNDFEGRARWGKTMPQGDTDKDGNGHGTHCAGTIGSKTYGVAKNAELVAVKVLGSGGSGSMSDVTAGVLWAVEDAKAQTARLAADPASEKAKKHKGFVANMSLGGGKSPTLDRAVNGAVDAGLHFAVAAGNENQDACNSSPAAAKNPLTIMASDVGDKRAYFSNYGPCADFFAPGLNIKSTWNTGPDAINTISGTSMATPHVVGLLAYYLSIYGTQDFATIDGAIPMRSLEQHAAALARHHGAAAAAGAGALARGARALLAASPALAGLLPAALLDRLLAASAPERELELAASSAGGKAPDVYSVLHPQDLKKAIIALGTKGAITDVGQGTKASASLAFNNATSVHKH